MTTHVRAGRSACIRHWRAIALLAVLLATATTAFAAPARAATGIGRYTGNLPSTTEAGGLRVSFEADQRSVWTLHADGDGRLSTDKRRSS